MGCERMGRGEGSKLTGARRSVSAAAATRGVFFSQDKKKKKSSPTVVVSMRARCCEKAGGLASSILILWAAVAWACPLCRKRLVPCLDFRSLAESW